MSGQTSGSQPADAGTPWQITLAAEFSACADALTAHMSSSMSDSELATLVNQRAAFQSAATDLRANALDSLLAGEPSIAKSLADATTAAKNAATDIKQLAAVVGMATALLGLATAIGTAVGTGNPSGLPSAINSVVKAAMAFGKDDSY